MRLCVAVGVLFLAMAAPAQACTAPARMPGEPDRRLEQSDAAFIGQVVRVALNKSRRGGMRIVTGATFWFRTHQVVKGRLWKRVRVQSSVGEASCGLNLRRGQTVGLFLHRHRGRWVAGLWDQTTPEGLLSGAQPACTAMAR